MEFREQLNDPLMDVLDYLVVALDCNTLRTLSNTIHFQLAPSSFKGFGCFSDFLELGLHSIHTFL